MNKSNSFHKSTKKNHLDNENIPQLRFSEFSNEWENLNIGDILEICYGKDYKDLNEGDIPVLGTGGVITHVDSFLYDKESVMIGRKGTINKPVFYDKPFWTVDTLFYTKIKKDYCPKFVYYLFSTINWLKYNEATGVPSLTSNNIKKIKVKCPSYEEQKQISELFTTLDQKIAFMEKKYNYLFALKDYFLKNMFCYNKNIPDMRFNGFDEEWDVIKLKDCCTITMGQSPSSTNYTNNPKETILIQGNQELIDGLVVPRVYTTEITKISTPGDIIFTVRAPVGDIAINNYNACIGRGVCSLSDMEDNAFIYYYLEYLSNMHVWNRYSQGSTFESINSKDIKNLKIKLPSLKEQNKISDLISAIDEKISFMEKEIKLQKNFKKLLLSKMFC